MLAATLTGIAAVTALVGCGTATGTSGPVAGRAAPDLAAVTTLDDVRDWHGQVTARIAHPGVDPVAEDPRPHLPVTLTDAQGTNVTVKDTSRILALDVYGTYARTVFELGLGDHLVGRDVSTQFDEAKDLPLVTTRGHELNAEAILDLDPSVVLVDSTLGPWDAVLQIRDSGIPVVVLPSERSIDNVTTLTRAVGRALGVPGAAAALAKRIGAGITEVEKNVRAAAPSSTTDRLRTIFLYVRGKSGVYYMFGEGSGADSLITTLGLYDVADEIGWNGMKPVTDEGIVAAQPDLILMMSDGLASVGGVDGLLQRLPALAQTPAGENHRIVTMQDSEILGFGPLTASVLNALAVAIYAPAAVSEESS